MLSETWNYPSWLFLDRGEVEVAEEGGEDCSEGRVVVVECGEGEEVLLEDSEDEGWYSLSRTDVRKLQEARETGESVNIILTNPGDVRGYSSQEPSPERSSYRWGSFSTFCKFVTVLGICSSLSSGDSGQLSEEGGAESPDSGQHSQEEGGEAGEEGSPGPETGTGTAHKVEIFSSCLI